MIVLKVVVQDALQMALVHHDDVVQAFSSDGTDQALGQFADDTS
jgi:hypothetical protein